MAVIGNVGSIFKYKVKFTLCGRCMKFIDYYRLEICYILLRYPTPKLYLYTVVNNVVVAVK